MLMIFSTSFGRKLESRAAGEPAVAEWYDSAPSDCAAGDDAYRGDAAALPVGRMIRQGQRDLGNAKARRTYLVDIADPTYPFGMPVYADEEGYMRRRVALFQPGLDVGGIPAQLTISRTI